MVLLIVLTFPLLLAVGYGLVFVLTGRDRRILLGPAGFFFYLALLEVPLIVVLANYPELPGQVLAWRAWTPIWLAAGLVVGLALWGVQLLVLRRGGELSGAASPVWVGPPGRVGFVLLMVPVACIVLAEELVWRAYLQTLITLPLAAVAFALHHYHFGLRHMVFSWLAGLYNVLAWRHLRRRSAGPEP
jgi:membrane protease YdiL (CAAX protease family)